MARLFLLKFLAASCAFVAGDDVDIDGLSERIRALARDMMDENPGMQQHTTHESYTAYALDPAFEETLTDGDIISLTATNCTVFIGYKDSDMPAMASDRCLEQLHSFLAQLNLAPVNPLVSTRKH